MCTRTKTSYGCGHSLKDKVPCGDPDCDRVDKYAFLKDGDCRACRSGGETVTRGRDGRGRYARTLQRPREADSTSPSSKHRPTKLDIDTNQGPWMPEARLEKVWNSPTRKKADRAWVDEHEDRIYDLSEKTAKLSLSSKSSRDSSPRERRGKTPTIIDADEPEFVASRSRKDKRSKTLPYEIRIVEGEVNQPDRTRRHRKYSHDSEDSMPHYFDSPVSSHSHIKTKVITPQSEYDFYPLPTESKRRRRYGAKTEPHYARSYTYDSPTFGSPHSGGFFTDHYELIQPHQYNFVYPRSYRVH